jgi:hypothetical protein
MATIDRNSFKPGMGKFDPNMKFVPTLELIPFEISICGLFCLMGNGRPRMLPELAWGALQFFYAPTFIPALEVLHSLYKRKARGRIFF